MMKKTIISVAILGLAFLHGFAFAGDATSQFKSRNAAQSISASKSFSESIVTAKASGISSKGISAGFSHPKGITAMDDGIQSSSAISEQAFVSGDQSIANDEHTQFSRTRCVSYVVSKGVEDKVCETTFISSMEARKHF